MGIRKIKIGDYCDVIKGGTGIKKAIEGEYPLVVTAEKRLTHNEYQFNCKAVLVPLVSSTGHGHASIKRIHYQEGKFALGTILSAIIIKDEGIINPKFLHIYLSYFKDHLLVPLMKGAANVTLTIKKIKSVEITIPSIERQLEIIELEKNNSIIQTLNNEISSQKHLLTQLKQSILQEAIQGKLTEDWRKQNPDTEPASELLKRIKAEKAQLIKDKKLKKGNTIKHPISLIDNVKIPNNWKWCKADDILFITKLAGFEYTKHISLQTEGEIPVIRAQNVRPIDIDKKKLLYIDKKTSLLLDRCSLTKQCLLVTFIGAGIGDVATFNEKNRWHLAPNVAKMEPFIKCEEMVNVKYLNYFLLSFVGQKEIFKHIKATAQPSLSMGTIRDIDFPIPPIEEKNEIVKRIDVLMQHCQTLEEEIKTSEANAQMLMQAVLKEAFDSETTK
ncbi:restriction endonuclease subunit S [Aureivirga sp. CE67]|uniref:restriction endonuclease subunit S n=1 Tax=Aureivirga sp. CE67 TaxID=1788983 RepID=UPI0018CA4BD2|nr:restriction endonuclease subunit S [Aureivirga sp. CE67]